MTRGLSKLQRSILKLAYQNRPQDPNQPCEVIRSDVLQSLYGWRPVRHRFRASTPIFDRQEVGMAKYRAAQVSVTKAINRLKHRGLVTYSMRCLQLTPTGVDAAAAMMPPV